MNKNIIFFYKYPFCSLLVTLFILIPSVVFSQDSKEAWINKFDFRFVSDGIIVEVNLINTLPEKSPETIAERIKFLDKGTEAKLIYKISIHKNDWWRSYVEIGGKKELIITRTLKKDIIYKIYTIKETSNVVVNGLLEDEYTFGSSVLDDELFKNEKIKYLKENFFEKELKIKIKYSDLKLKEGSEYFLNCKIDYIAYNPIFGSGKPANFYIEKDSKTKKFIIEAETITRSKLKSSNKDFQGLFTYWEKINKQIGKISYKKIYYNRIT